MSKTGCDDYELHLTGKGNFRDSNPLGYKGNRVGTRKPTDFEAIRNYLVDEYKAVINTGMEADDVVVYLKTTYPEKYFLCAIDKDVLYQTEGTHYNYGEDKFLTVSKRFALWFPYVQALAGDPTDGYTGVPGMGMTKALKVLRPPEKNCDLLHTLMDKYKVSTKARKELIELTPFKNRRELWARVLLSYRNAGLRRGDAINTMRLADMRQYNGSRVKLWTPVKRKDRK